MTREEFIAKWCDPERVLEMSADLDSLEPHYWEFSVDKTCGCEKCNPDQLLK